VGDEKKALAKRLEQEGLDLLSYAVSTFAVLYTLQILPVCWLHALALMFIRFKDSKWSHWHAEGSEGRWELLHSW
jgi:hypothetical protein